MRKLSCDVLRLKFESGLSERVIARSMSLSNGSVSKRQLSGKPEGAFSEDELVLVLREAVVEAAHQVLNVAGRQAFDFIQEGRGDVDDGSRAPKKRCGCPVARARDRSEAQQARRPRAPK